MDTNWSLIINGFILLTGLSIVWLLWEINQKIHKLLEVTWTSAIAFEKRIDRLSDIAVAINNRR